MYKREQDAQKLNKKKEKEEEGKKKWDSDTVSTTL